MAYNWNLFNLSRQVIEPYVINFLSKREKVDHVELSNQKEDMQDKIDVKVFVKNGNVIPVQIKTREKNYPNFSIPKKDIINEQENRVFCFIDKTFDAETVNKLLELNEMAMNAIQDESPKILMLTQKKFLEDLTQFTYKEKNGDGYYLVPKEYLKKLKYNKEDE
ncbi:MAG: hypothetical protein [Wendovervirus sonii]|uniref:Uncharacterized protein n=1 Tax=phage Lak_Megaphage_Sonny TaxID=3109229 RepID=A0ABZ0Z666_9CAUD|nr:MAG: hypothetical protein [phage Lak_Megaphage_Sonny]